MAMEIINTYATQIISTVFISVIGILGIYARKLAREVLSDETKRILAKNAMQFVEQTYKDLHGEEKMGQALTAAAKWLAEKRIDYDESEMRFLIEAALAEFNAAYRRD